MTILGERIRLRAIERSDIPTFVRWFNDPEVTKNLVLYLPLSQAQEERWFEAQLEDKNRRILGVETLDGKLIGNIGLENINWKDSRAELGIVIGDKEAEEMLATHDEDMDKKAFQNNAERLEQRMSSVGLLRRLSDGCAYVINPYAARKND